MGMPGFHGQGSQEFALAAGSVHGYRWWSLNAPDLQRDPSTAEWNPVPLLGQTQTYCWKPGVNEAACIYHPGQHQPPVERDERTGLECGCGFWGYWTPPAWPHFYDAGLYVLGVIEGFGRTLFGSEGFRSQKSRIVALHLASEFELVVSDSTWHSQWSRAFSRPGLHHPPAGRPPGISPGVISQVMREEARQRMEAWQAVIEDRLGLMYPDARVMTVRRALLALHPPYRDRPKVALPD